MPQRSNRSELIEGTLRCLECLPPEQVTARAIAAEAGANLASITYHFGSKDALVSEAVTEGLDRWLAEIAAALTDAALPDLDAADPADRFRRAAEAVEMSRQRHTALARTFVVALARAQHDPLVRDRLAAGFHRTRPALAAILGLGDDPAGHDAAGLVVALFNGWLLQSLLDPALAIGGDRMQRAQARLRNVLPADVPESRVSHEAVRATQPRAMREDETGHRPPAGVAERSPRSSGPEENRPRAGVAERSPRSSGRNLEEYCGGEETSHAAAGRG